MKKTNKLEFKSDKTGKIKIWIYIVFLVLIIAIKTKLKLCNITNSFDYWDVMFLIAVLTYTVLYFITSLIGESKNVKNNQEADKLRDETLLKLYPIFTNEKTIESNELDKNIKDIQESVKQFSKEVYKIIKPYLIDNFSQNLFFLALYLGTLYFSFNHKFTDFINICVCFTVVILSIVSVKIITYFDDGELDHTDLICTGFSLIIGMISFFWPNLKSTSVIGGAILFYTSTQFLIKEEKYQLQSTYSYLLNDKQENTP